MKAVNLIPSEHRKGGAVGRRSQGAAFAVLGLLAGAAILTFLYGSAKHQLESRQSEAAALTKRASQVQAQAEQLTSYTSFIQMREQRLQEISTLINSRFAWSSAMGELSRVLPTDVALSSFQGTVGAQSAGATAPSSASSSTTASSTSTSSAATASASVSSATPAGASPTFTLAGCAASQIVVAQTLVRLRLISGVSNVTLLSSARSSSGGGSTGAGACPPGAPVFSMDITFQPLPNPPATSTQTLESTVSATKSKASSTASTGTAGASDRTIASTVKGADR